jgi:hypothetical protein
MDYTGRIITKNPQTPSANGAPGIWTLDEAMQYTKQGKWPPGYQISRSVRLRGSANAYLNRTPSSASNRDAWTWSSWVKLGTLTTNVNWLLLAGTQSVTDTGLYFYSDNTLQFFNRASSAMVGYIYTTAVFRDPSAWYHVVAVYDSLNATATDRMQLWVNGVRQTVTVSTQLSSGADSSVNNNVAHFIGAIQAGGTSANNFDGYMTEINFIDGQALNPTSFGYTDTATGVWQPAPYAGTYGTNGFYLNFSDNSAATATTIGKDYSGNGNNWTPNNISVTAGATYDSMVDVPINWGTDSGVGGEMRGNYATLNPIANGTAAYVKAGNLQINPSDGNFQPSLSTIGVSSGKWYAECTITAVGSGAVVGIDKFPSTLVATNYIGNTATSYGYYGDGTNARLYNNSSFTSYGATYTTGAVIGVALDMDAGTLLFYRNNTSQGTAATGLSGTYAIGASPAGSAGIADMNYGQRPFVYTAPSGYKALCTQNLPVPTVLNGASYMAATLYTGNGGTNAISNAVNNIAFQPDLVWVKSRSAVGDNKWTDSVRGVTKGLVSNTTAAETTDTNGVTAFGTTGFTVGSDTSYNNSGATYVGWQWKASGSTVSNTSGSITSTVSANTTAGFSILTYTGTGATGTIGHGLGATPSMMIVKKRSNAGSWKMYHASLGNTKIVEVNDNGAAQTSSTYWNNTSPTSTLITVGSNGDINASGETYVSYCWTAISGYSEFGSYVGNGSADGVFVYCGFRPRFVMVKKTNGISSWTMLDSSRSPSNVVNKYLYANETSADNTFTFADFLANGFKWRTTEGSVNASGDTFIYMVFAENPFTIARAR